MNKPVPAASISVDADTDDITLVKQAQAGDTAAFEVLFNRYYRRALQLAIGVLKNGDEAKDVVQDAFIKAHRNLSKFEGKSSFYTWLYRIVMNLCIDYIRKRKRKRQVQVEDTEALLDIAAAQTEHAILPSILGQDPSLAIQRKEIRQHVEEALGKLSDKHRAVIVMREVEGLSYHEIADVLECSKGTVMSRLFHARKNMQQTLTLLMKEKKHD